MIDTSPARPGPSVVPRSLRRVQVLRMTCCDREWVGADRAHCCGRFGGCGAVFDDAELWDTHRPRGACVADPGELGLIATRNGIWLRPLDAAG
ncbi:hypothetical protein GCM10009613_55820 [Pseudonocardia kongjuensis]|uniref:Phage FDXHR zinc binding domain-containing protein n=2 Tax=Pseudonocardia kongjuensis TaxID=102227 RepID=A0ABN1Y749_9PSEU